MSTFIIIVRFTCQHLSSLYILHVNIYHHCEVYMSTFIIILSTCQHSSSLWRLHVNIHHQCMVYSSYPKSCSLSWHCSSRTEQRHLPLPSLSPTLCESHPAWPAGPACACPASHSTGTPNTTMSTSQQTTEPEHQAVMWSSQNVIQYQLEHSCDQVRTSPNWNTRQPCEQHQLEQPGDQVRTSLN